MCGGYLMLNVPMPATYHTCQPVFNRGPPHPSLTCVQSSCKAWCMNEWNVASVLRAMSRAGDIALQYYENPTKKLKSDLSIVTEADYEIEQALIEIFENSADGSYLIGEETVDKMGYSYIEAAMEQVAWIIDPIDGTASYAHHIPTWGISIARMKESVITDGAIYLPVTGEIFITHGSDILYGAAEYSGLTGVKLEPLETIHPEPNKGGMIALTQAVAKLGRINVPNPVQALACAVFPLTYLLMGRYLGYIGNLKLWDIAGALAMLTRAGFHCVLMDGTSVDCGVTNNLYNLDNPDQNEKWRLRDRLVCGGSEAAAKYLIDSISQDGN